MSKADSPPSFGYLHVADLGGPNLGGPNLGGPEPGSDEDRSEGPWVGGYLIVSAAGRPLEFHCTAPVVASRAQSILYGRSLEAFVVGEHLGGTLVSKARLKPSVLLVDNPHADAAGRAASLATVLLGVEAAPPGAEPLGDLPPSDRPINAWLMSRGAETGAEQVLAALQQLARSVDLTEPFERIREAIGEAQQGVGEPEADALDTGAPHRDAA